ncbi:trypsin-like peptidase domain-containing protein [bacterium]|nr:trypsin-like peptidase domain-containing protein [bacterium]
MSVRLNKADQDQIIAVVSKLPQFRNVRDRQRFIDSTLGGTPASEKILGMLDLDGEPVLVAVEVVTKLSQFGQVEYGREALGVFLNGVIDAIGSEQADRLRELFSRYALGGSTPPQPPVGPWPKELTNFTQEKVIGENTMFPVHVLQRAIESARSVVHLTVASARPPFLWSGTGFLVANDLVMTNHHNVSSKEEAARTTVTFNYQLGVDGKPCPTTEQTLAEGSLLCANQDLDYAILRLPVPADVPALALGRIAPPNGDPVTIIQHPGGHLKQISLRNNAVQFSDSRRILYTTSTERGASGAPLLAHTTFEVVGLHHGGGELADPTSGNPSYRNEAIAMAAILGDLKSRCAAIYERLTGVAKPVA